VLARAALVSLASLALAAPAWAGGRPVALVTAESENEVLAVSLPDGTVLRRVHVPDAESIAAGVTGPAVVVSPSGTVTILAWRSLRPLATLRFRSPQIAALVPGGQLVYVTDAEAGDLAVVSLASWRVVARVFVGSGAHHLAVSPDGRRTWVALGERAATIVVLDTSRPSAPRVVARFHPRVPAHDLAFAPDGRTVWVTSAVESSVSVLDARDGRLLGTVPAGPAPQHVVFVPYGRPHAIVTSGYGSSLETVDVGTRRVLRRVEMPYGSFNVATSGDLVVTASLLNGTVTELAGPRLRRTLTTRVAPATRAVAISVW
jgi:serine/threonine-protein kinase